MAIRMFQLTLAATPRRLSDVYGGTPGVPDVQQDVSFRELFLQAEGADFYLGDAAVAINNYGAKFAVTGQTLHGGAIGPFPSGAVRLSDFYAVGAGATIHIIGVPF